MQDRLLVVGKKVGMTRLYDKNNCLLPVTVVSVEPCRVSQIKTDENDGYQAIQIAYREKKHIIKPMKGHLEKANIKELLSSFKEFTTDDVTSFSIGQLLSADVFSEGNYVDVVAISKGKGFQGVVRRYDFGGGRATHGSMSHRRGGSYGHFRRMGHVIKNQKMPGHMGCAHSTIQNLLVVKVIPEKRLIALKGSVPGSRGCFLTIRKAKKCE